MRRAAKRDANEAEIVRQLRGLGVTVLQLDEIDLLCGWQGRNWLFEVKRPGKRKQLRPSQIKLRETWRGQYHIIETFDEALRIMEIAA